MHFSNFNVIKPQFCAKISIQNTTVWNNLFKFTNIFLQVSFVDRRCPDMHMFEVNTGTGISNAKFNSHLDNESVMEMKYTDFYNRSSRTAQYRKSVVKMRQSPPFPTNGFNMNLAIRYSNEFANAFGNAAENTYVYNSNQNLLEYHWTRLKTLEP